MNEQEIADYRAGRPLMLPTQPRFADMSSAQRSASMDNIVRQVETLTQQANAQQREIVRVAQRTADFVYDIATDTWSAPAEIKLRATLKTFEEALKALAVIVACVPQPHATFWQRLRWLVTGR